MNTLTLDTLLERELFPPPKLIKIDVQGAEEEVLNGSSKTLLQAQVVILELSIVNSYASGLLAGA